MTSSSLHNLASRKLCTLLLELDHFHLKSGLKQTCYYSIRMSQADDVHTRFLQLALEEARKCIPTPTAFCVGSVITASPTSSSEPLVLATGYSRELPGNTHAEANALAKLRALSPSQLASLIPGLSPEISIDELLARADIYATMEPCSVRTSGLAPCANAIIAAGIRRCYIGVGEPDDFVKCEGTQRLKDAGVEVIWVKGLEKECLDVARGVSGKS